MTFATTDRKSNYVFMIRFYFQTVLSTHKAVLFNKQGFQFIKFSGGFLSFLTKTTTTFGLKVGNISIVLGKKFEIRVRVGGWQFYPTFI